MKRFRVLFLLLLVVFSFLLPQRGVSASSRYFEVSKFDIAVDIQENGDAKVVEKITYRFDGEFNGVFRDIDYSRTSGLADLTVGLLDNGSSIPFTEAYTGAPFTYEVDDTGSLSKLKIYEKSTNEEKTFVIGYTLQNVAEKYNDISTFNRKIIDSGWDIPLNNITITITIPEGAKKEDLRVFAHGPLTGASQIVDDRTFLFTVPSVSGRFVETLAVFPRDLIPTSTNTFANDELQNILDNEQRLADEANQQREEAIREQEREAKRQEREKAARPIFGAGILAGLGSIFFMFRKYGKEIRATFEGDYYRELPEDYSPAVMTYLLTKGQSKDVDIMATILDLARKKVIKLTPVSVEKGMIFKKEEETFEMTWQDKSKLDTLLPHEKFLATWFLDEIGNGNGLVLEDLEKILKSNKAALQFQKDYTYFKHKVKETGEKQKFFQGNELEGSTVFVILGLVLILGGLIGLFVLGSFFGIILSAVGMFLLFGLLAMRFVRKYSQKGVDHKAMWLAFKKFLQHFSNMKEAEVPSLVIWEHYLVYATSLGVADEVIDQLPKVFSEQELMNPDLTYMGGYRSFSNFYIMNQAFSNTMTRVNSAVSTAQIAASQKSSGSGFGGGFSGGSSGGGGGGGGGGAF